MFTTANAHGNSTFTGDECTCSHDKIAGSILGAAIGDALGAPVEFLSYAQIKKQYPPNGVEGIHNLKPNSFGNDADGKKVLPYTDDTAMSIVVLKALLKNKDKSVSRAMNQLAREFVYDLDNPYGWARAQRAPGNACLKNIEKLEKKMLALEDTHDIANWWKAGGLNDGGCGSVMRAHPFGLIFANDVAKAELWAVEQSKITHGAPIALAACAAMAVGVAGALQGFKSPVEVAEDMITAAAKYDTATARMIEKAVAYANDRSVSSQRVFEEFLGWSAHEAIAAATYIFVRFSDDLRNAILAGVNTPGDSDSIASMAGALVGARVGCGQLPAAWLKPLEGLAELKKLAHQVAKAQE